MVSQRSKLNIIVIVGLCMINLMGIKTDEYMLPMSLGGDGARIVDFKGIIFPLDSDFQLTVQDADCTYQVQYDPFERDDKRQRKTRRNGTKNCKSQQSTSR
uniref:Uncharacterized protein n=1 Tax=Trichobilharzia regenti TaxID=157069 RepID=A0AA85KK03_TRIRE|nr:unnamed protein product [Trichobilharzia regenti]